MKHGLPSARRQEKKRKIFLRQDNKVFVTCDKCFGSRMDWFQYGSGSSFSPQCGSGSREPDQYHTDPS